MPPQRTPKAALREHVASYHDWLSSPTPQGELSELRFNLDQHLRAAETEILGEEQWKSLHEFEEFFDLKTHHDSEIHWEDYLEDYDDPDANITADRVTTVNQNVNLPIDKHTNNRYAPSISPAAPAPGGRTTALISALWGSGAGVPLSTDERPAGSMDDAAPGTNTLFQHYTARGFPPDHADHILAVNSTPIPMPVLHYSPRSVDPTFTRASTSPGSSGLDASEAFSLELPMNTHTVPVELGYHSVGAAQMVDLPNALTSESGASQGMEFRSLDPTLSATQAPDLSGHQAPAFPVVGLGASGLSGPLSSASSSGISGVSRETKTKGKTKDQDTNWIGRDSIEDPKVLKHLVASFPRHCKMSTYVTQYVVLSERTALKLPSNGPVALKAGVKDPLREEIPETNDGIDIARQSLILRQVSDLAKGEARSWLLTVDWFLENDVLSFLYRSHFAMTFQKYQTNGPAPSRISYSQLPEIGIPTPDGTKFYDTGSIGHVPAAIIRYLLKHNSNMKLNVQTNLTFFLERIILLGWVGSKEALRGLVAGGSDRVGSFQPNGSRSVDFTGYFHSATMLFVFLSGPYNVRLSMFGVSNGRSPVPEGNELTILPLEAHLNNDILTLWGLEHSLGIQQSNCNQANYRKTYNLRRKKLLELLSDPEILARFRQWEAAMLALAEELFGVATDKQIKPSDLAALNWLPIFEGVVSEGFNVYGPYAADYTNIL